MTQRTSGDHLITHRVDVVAQPCEGQRAAPVRTRGAKDGLAVGYMGIEGGFIAPLFIEHKLVGIILALVQYVGQTSLLLCPGDRRETDHVIMECVELPSLTVA